MIPILNYLPYQRWWNSHLCNVSYSGDAKVTAFKEYFHLLTRMCLDPEHVVYPPNDGWPEITAASMPGFNKTDEVIDLLPHLPYIVDHTGSELLVNASSQVGPLARGANNSTQPNHWLDYTQGVWDNIAGLVDSRHYEMFLDTKLGIISFVGGDSAPGPVIGAAKPGAPYPSIRDDSVEFASEEEDEWRSAGAAWAVEDFFVMLEFHFQQLHYIPVSYLEVEESFGQPEESGDAWGQALRRVQELYRRYGWPDLQVYQKDACLEAASVEVQEGERSDPDVIFAA